MSDFGQKLRAARERRGVSLRHISERTKFSVASLEALERSDASRLPGGIFARAFVRSYAAEVGLDPEATVREFIERFDVEPPPSALVEVDSSALAGDGAPLAIMPTILKLVAISLVAVALILYFTRLRHADDSTVAPTDARRTSQRVVTAVPKDAALP
jgi:cytoskeletal protein RodZ